MVSVVIGFWSLIGCASNTPAPERSSSEIKSDADRNFDKMKQEEQQRQERRDREIITR
jgi:hypothetical protein